MDIFTEQIVKRKLTGKDWLISLGLVLAASILIYVSIFILLPLTGLPMIPLIVILGSIYGVYWLISSRNLEYEYSVTNGDLTVDKIINKRRRKRMVSFDVRDAEEIGKYDATKLAQRQFDKTLMAAEDETAENTWYIMARTPKYGRMVLVFTPNEKVLDGIKAGLPRQMRIDVFGRN
ncbi:MAG TPA: hypothetical protein IAA80_09520 [Candidatus Gallacutalibacter pullistercoris]|nr:hypothetical protein [Candidatus Gallacutalibacter pullistercoris]